MVHALACTIELWSTQEVWRARKKRKSCPRQLATGNSRGQFSREFKWLHLAKRPFSLDLAQCSHLIFEECHSELCGVFGISRNSIFSRFLRREILTSNLCFLHCSVISQRCRVYFSPRTCISYLQIISTTRSRKTAICQTQTSWLDKRLKRLD